MNSLAALKLARFHKPAGTLLLWSPTAWALWIAYSGSPPLNLVLLFFLGTVLMRAAGCVINDMIDINVDPWVKRTRERPLAAKEMLWQEALGWLFFLLLAALMVLLQLPWACFYPAMLALMVTVLYPFCKRFFHCPQLILSIAFSMGIPMVFEAANESTSPLMLYLFMINFLWILAYDTQYAMADRADDIKIGVKSFAILLGKYDRKIIAGLQCLSHLLWLKLAFSLGLSLYFYAIWGLSSVLIIYQHSLLRTKEENNYIKAFASNVWYGALLWLGLMLGF